MWRDIRHGWHFLTSHPLFTFSVVTTLALGIGVNTAMFAIVYSVLLRPLPYEHSQQLVKISYLEGQDMMPFTFNEFRSLASRAAALQSLAAYFSQNLILSGDNGSENVTALRASSSLLTTLAVRPVIGPGFSPGADTPGTPHEIMLSDSLWHKDYQAGRDVLGRYARIGDASYRIVGVLPPTFQFVKGLDILIPLRLDAASAPPSLHFLEVVGRMHENFTPDSTAAELGPAEGAAAGRSYRVHVASLQQEIVSRTRLPVLLMFGAACLILLIASVNVANLLLVRSVSRRRELAIRIALGGSWSRIARLFFVESAAISLAGGTAGLFLAWLVLVWAQKSALSLIARSEEVTLVPGVLLFTGALSVIVALVLNVGALLQGRVKNLNQSLRTARQSGPTASARRWQDALVAAEIALTVTLMCGAGLLIRSFAKIVSQNKGFSTERVFSINCILTNKYNDSQRIKFFYDQVRQHIAALPGVESVGIASAIPLTGSAYGTVTLSGSSQKAEVEYTANKILTDAGYFSTLRIPLLAGRLFDRRDSEKSSPVAIIDQTLARQACGDSACLGKLVHFGWGKEGLSQIIGIVGPVRQDDLETQPKATVYVPYLQTPELLEQVGLRIVARTSLEPKSATFQLRAAILDVDKYQPPPEVRTMIDLVDSSLLVRKVISASLGSIAGLAVFLSILGIYGTMSYAVATRAPEFGLRLALGAQRKDVVLLILRHAAVLASVGLVLGFAGATAGTRFLASILYGTSSFDAVTFASVAPCVVLMVLVAAWVPVRTALGIDPASALKCE